MPAQAQWSAQLVLAAAMNLAEIPVRRKPKVAILATGDEVVPPGLELAPDQIVSSVPYGSRRLVEAEGGEAMRLGIAKDDIESLVTLARAGRAADILVDHRRRLGRRAGPRRGRA